MRIVNFFIIVIDLLTLAFNLIFYFIFYYTG